MRRQRASFDSSFAALYYRWVSVADPQPLQLPPSAFVAGVCPGGCRARRLEAPANELLRGAIGLEVALDAARQEPLDAEGINVLRSFADRGVRVWGARSISSDAEWKYVNVRRLLIYIEQSIDRGLQWPPSSRTPRRCGCRALGQAGTAARPARVRAMMVFMICAVPSPIWNPSTSRSRCSIGPRS